MAIVADSPSWQHIDKVIDKELAKKIKNKRLCLSLDGMKPHSM
jgi:hypothetical protein